MPRFRIAAIVLAAAAITTITAASAQQFDPKVLREAPQASKSQPSARPRASNSCAEYGAGYVRVEGTSTCMRIGGAVGIDARIR